MSEIDSNFPKAIVHVESEDIWDRYAQIYIKQQLLFAPPSKRSRQETIFNAEKKKLFLFPINNTPPSISIPTIYDNTTLHSLMTDPLFIVGGRRNSVSTML